MLGKPHRSVKEDCSTSKRGGHEKAW